MKAVQPLGDRTVDALIKACNNAGVKPFIIYSADLSGLELREILNRLVPLEPRVVAVHAEISNSRDMEKIVEKLSIVREYGSTLRLVTHVPGVTIPWVEETEVPVDVFVTPLNSLGYAIEPSFERSLVAMQRCSCLIVAIENFFFVIQVSSSQISSIWAYLGF